MLYPEMGYALSPTKGRRYLQLIHPKMSKSYAVSSGCIFVRTDADNVFFLITFWAFWRYSDGTQFFLFFASFLWPLFVAGKKKKGEHEKWTDLAAFWIAKKNVDPPLSPKKLQNRSKQWPTPITISPAHILLSSRRKAQTIAIYRR